MSAEQQEPLRAAIQQVVVEQAVADAKRMSVDEIAEETDLKQRMWAAPKVLRKHAWSGNMSDDELKAFELTAFKHGGSIIMGDFDVLGGKLYAKVNWLMKKAVESGQFVGFCKDEPLPRRDWETWGVREDAEHAWITGVERKDQKYPIYEVGWAGGSREKEANQGRGQPVAKAFAAEMARKRARSRALALAFPTGLASADDWAPGIEIPQEIMDRAMKAPPVSAAIVEKVKAKKEAAKPAPDPTPAKANGAAYPCNLSAEGYGTWVEKAKECGKSEADLRKLMEINSNDGELDADGLEADLAR